MIISQTPLRISLFGGGSDLPGFWLKETGAVISTAIDKYVYVIAKERFDEKIRIGYTRTEIVDRIEDIQHELVRESLRKVGLKKSLEIATMSDVPAEGTGLGSSSAITVGLLNALHTYEGTIVTASTLAHQACDIEINILQKPIGKQDQYIAAFGGLRLIQFLSTGEVTVDSLNMPGNHVEELSRRFLLFHTGLSRKAETVLVEQNQKTEDNRTKLRELVAMAWHCKDALESREYDEIGLMLDRSWKLKKQLADTISNTTIDEIYDTAIKAGALGGKITGAGGGGFLLLYSPLGKQEEIISALQHLRVLPFRFVRDGTKIIFNNRRG